MTRLIILATVAALILAVPPVAAGCIMSYCQNRQGQTPSRSHITDINRRIVGDLYDPGHGRRVQIRDADRRIIGYIERSGKITDTRRRKVGSIQDLRE